MYVCVQTGELIMEIINKVPKGCLITVVADCCFSGGLIKCAKKQTTTNTLKESSLLTASPSDQISKETKVDGIFYGAFGNALVDVIEKSHGQNTNAQLLESVSKILQSQGFNQKPETYCNFDHNAVF